MITGQKQHNGQISDSMALAVVLALSGGWMDAYTYLLRGRVFANAQTGNILLLGVNLAEGRGREAVKYLFPVFAFALGILAAEAVRAYNRRLHWRQSTLLLESVILLVVGFLPVSYNALANALVSFACGMQVESFRKVHGNACATTMCIGNLRSGTQALCDWLFQGKREALSRVILYYGLILAFTIGAICGNGTVKLLGTKAVWCSSALLFAGFGMMFLKPGTPKNNSSNFIFN